MPDRNALAINVNTLKEWQDIADLLTTILGSPIALINRNCETMIETEVSSNSEGNPFKAGAQFPFEGVYCGEVIRSRESLRVSNALEDDKWKNSLEAELGMLSYLGFPIFDPSGEVFGTICVVDRIERSYTQVQQKVVEKFKVMVEGHLALLLRNIELEKRIAEIKMLRKLLPICSSCKKIRDDKGYWNQIENYITLHTDTEFSHGLCPECIEKLYPEYCSDDDSQRSDI